jgi:hypothetical protein
LTLSENPEDMDNPRQKDSTNRKLSFLTLQRFEAQ